MLALDFKPVKPTTEQTVKVSTVGELFYELALKLEQLLPDSAHKTASLRKLFESKMAATHSITHAPYQPK